MKYPNTQLKGTIITNPFDNNQVQRDKVFRMRQEFAQLGVQIQVVPNDSFVAYVKDGKAYTNLETDFVLYFDKDKYVAQLLECCGIRVFNSALATALCDDKMQTHISLCNFVPMPKTLSGALCYNPQGQIDPSYLQKAVDILGLPIVVKQCFGSFGEQVYLASTLDELSKIVSNVKTKAYLLQEFVQGSAGKDVRVIVIGGKVACAMLRQNDNDFRSNVSLGGKAVAYTPSQQIVDICQTTAKVLGLDYCGIDVLLGETPLVCEVNSNAMFGGMESATGVNVAKLYATHIVNSISK